MARWCRTRKHSRALLDQLFACRMNAVARMLAAERGGPARQWMLIAESGNNGVLEFDASSQVEKVQPPLLVEARVLDEVRRAECHYARNLKRYPGGLMFFTFENEYDHSIRLPVGGAAGMPSVMRSIEAFAAAAAAGSASARPLSSFCLTARAATGPVPHRAGREAAAR